jgi:predicted lipid-binding transport protein (Tim44 family)
MSESEEEQTAAESAEASAKPEPRSRERKLLLGGLRGGILGALILGLLAWGFVSGATSQNTEWRTSLAGVVAFMAMPFGFLIGAVIGLERARLKLKK